MLFVKSIDNSIPLHTPFMIDAEDKKDLKPELYINTENGIIKMDIETINEVGFDAVYVSVKDGDEYKDVCRLKMKDNTNRLSVYADMESIDPTDEFTI